MKNLILMTMVTGALIFAPAYHSGVCGQSMFRG